MTRTILNYSLKNLELSQQFQLLSSGFNTASAGAGITTFTSGFYTGRHAYDRVGGLSKPCHNCVTYKCKRLNKQAHHGTETKLNTCMTNNKQFHSCICAIVRNCEYRSIVSRMVLGPTHIHFNWCVRPPTTRIKAT